MREMLATPSTQGFTDHFDIMIDTTYRWDVIVHKIYSRQTTNGLLVCVQRSLKLLDVGDP